MTASGHSGNRLERALATYLAAAPTTPAEAERLLATNQDLADLLAPMLGREPAQASGAEAEAGPEAHAADPGVRSVRRRPPG